MHALVQPLPQRIGFGSGCAVGCADEFVSRGVRRALILTSPSVAPHAKPIVEALMARSIVVSAISDLRPDPTVRGFETLLASVRAFYPEGIIGFGGGSVLDLAKLTAAIHDMADPLPNLFGGDLLPRRKTVLACVPTTLGSGAELSPHVFLHDETTGREPFVSSHWLSPDLLFVDPLYNLTLPAASTAASALSALGLCLETVSRPSAFSLTQPFAVSAARLLAQGLRSSAGEGFTPRVRATLSLGGLQAALAAPPAATFTQQALAAPLARRLGLPRNLASAFVTLPLARLRARDSGASTETEGPDLALAEELFASSGLGAEQARISVSDSILAEIAANAFADPRLHKEDPARFSAASVAQLYRAAFGR